MGIFWNSNLENNSRNQIQQAAAGQGPSAARSQLAQGLSQVQNGMAAQAAGVRQNPLAAMRVAQQQGAQMAGQANMQAAQLRGQEQLQGQQQQMQLAQQDSANQSALIGGLMNMGSTALSGGLAGMAPKPEPGATSDVNAKRDIQPAGDRTDALLQNIRPEQYNYRDPAAHGQGNRLGVMAQDLQRADPNLVDRQPDGNLAINGPAALSASLAANARLAQRLDELETRVQGRRPGGALGGAVGLPAGEAVAARPPQSSMDTIGNTTTQALNPPRETPPSEYRGGSATQANYADMIAQTRDRLHAAPRGGFPEWDGGPTPRPPALPPATPGGSTNAADAEVRAASNLLPSDPLPAELLRAREDAARGPIHPPLARADLARRLSARGR